MNIKIDNIVGLVATVRQFTDSGPLDTKALVLEVLSPDAIRVQPLFGTSFTIPSTLILDLDRPDKVWKERSKVYIDAMSRGLELDDEQIAVLERLDIPTIGLVEDDHHTESDHVKTLQPGAFTIA